MMNKLPWHEACLEAASRCAASYIVVQPQEGIVRDERISFRFRIKWRQVLLHEGLEGWILTTLVSSELKSVVVAVKGMVWVQELGVASLKRFGLMSILRRLDEVVTFVEIQQSPSHID